MIFDKAFAPRAPTLKSTAGILDIPQVLLAALGVSGVSADHLSEATYFACLRIVSEAVGKLPMKLHQTLATQGTNAVPDHPLYDVLKVRPNPYTTAVSFFTDIEQQRNHYGNGYAWIQPVAGPERIRLWLLPSNQVDVWWDNGKILSQVPDIWYRWTGSDGKFRIFGHDEILHVRTWLSKDGITGLPVRKILSETIDGGIKAQRTVNKLYDNGMVGKSVLNYTGDLNDDLEKKFVANVQNYVDGKVDSSKTVIPMPLGTSLTPLNVKLADSQFVEIQKYTALQIAAAFGVKPDQINDYEKSSYSSSEAQQLAFLVDTLLWIIEQYEQEISWKLLSADERKKGYAFKFNTGVMMRTTTEKQITAMKDAVSGMIYTPDEARAHLDMCSKPGGDQLYAGNGSVIPLTMAGSQYSRKEGKTDGE